MKVLITGGAGFIGYYICKELIKQGDEVIVFDSFLNFIPPLKSHYNFYLQMRLKDLNNKITLVKGDIRNKHEFLREVKKHKPQRIVHLAALPIAPLSTKFSEDAISINLNGTINVLEALRECDFVDRFVLASSSMIYGDFQYSPADEKHPTKPKDVYGATKLSAEIITRAFSKQYGLDYTIIRPSAVYGPTDANLRVSQIFVDNALQGKPLTLHNGGQSKLDFSFVEDVANGFVLALKSEKAKNETFNITRGEGRSLKEFTEILKKLIPNLKVKSMPTPKNEKRPERGALDISKARKLLGYAPKYSLEEGLKKYVDFVKNCGVLKLKR